MQDSRRKFLLTSTQAIALSALGGIVWSSFLTKAEANLFVLRPPGALEEAEFLKHCIKCGLCVNACPFGTLKLADVNSAIPLGTPYFIAREVPCEMCPDIPCVPPCPTGALNAESLKDKDGIWEINNAKMGVAVVDTQNCVAHWGIQCDACYRACPLLGEAIKLELRRNERTKKHSFLLPVVDNEICTGCGKCEKACITEKAAITILPRDAVLGVAGSNYIKGWEAKDEMRLKDAKTKELKQDSKKAQNYLNSGEL
ncbi:MAG: ferredoxin-type protein NapG [Helicobacter sp.]|nr:ferredoxin-type protein NapG [Helicobacteraceae bacterium]MDY3113924.1 ferredoxin-type protein NapG [Helicobacter sp.]